MSDFNERVIAEFRANGGVVEMFGPRVVLLRTVGAKSGEPRTTPVVYRRDGDRLIVFASKAGAPEHPAWFHNILADPDLTIEVGQEGEVVARKARAVELHGEERDRLFEQQATEIPTFREYEQKTTRKIPVVEIELGDVISD